MSILGNDLLLAGTDEGYNLTRSLRFRSSASAYLNRTPASASNQKTWTWSGWLKRGKLGAQQILYYVNDGVPGTPRGGFYFDANDTFQIALNTSGSSWDVALYTTQVFRDPSAWYHFVISVDTTQATTANRIKIYVNENQITAFSTATYPTQNTNTPFNTTYTYYQCSSSASSGYFDGYLTEVNFIDGQALTPSSFGSTNTLTGVWQPARYTGTYGTNGFYLPFTDNSALTTSSNAGLGKDFSGNSNYWTTNNISITSGTTYDSMTDVPTLTSATAANFCIANPLDKQTDISVTQGNLQISTTAGAGNKQIRGSIALPSSGKFYWETKNTGSVNNFNMGLTTLTASLSTEGAGDMFYNEGGVIGNNGTNTSGYATLALNDTVGVAVDIDANKIYWYKNNTLVNSGGTTINITAPFAPMFGLYDNGNAQSITFGQRPFAYTPPTGYVALNTFNLPTSTIVKGNTVMDATTYTGNNSTNAIVNAAGFKPDLIWIKDRSRAGSHLLVDSVRGITKALSSDGTWSENTYSFSQMSSINSNGFTLTANTTSDNFYVNVNADTFVGWQWQAGQGTTSSNTNGTITSTVSVNASAGFSVVTATSPASGNAFTLGHGLGVAPQFIISKSRSGSGNWSMYHRSTGAGGYLLFTTAAYTANTDTWNNTTPTSSLISTTTNWWGNSANLVFYCWTPIAGYSAFGSYTGNGSSDGPMVYTGFKPRFLLIKKTATGGGDRGWLMEDTARSPYNAAELFLYANTSDAESNNQQIDFLSNGFKIRNNGLVVNDSGVTMIYAAFSSNPFKNSLAQ